jgi:hypothetical protein
MNNQHQGGDNSFYIEYKATGGYFLEILSIGLIVLITFSGLTKS